MRILCCLNRELASNVAFNLLLPALTAHEVMVGLSEPAAASLVALPPEASDLRRAEVVLPNDVIFPVLERDPAPSAARHLAFGELERARGIRVVGAFDANAPAGLDLVRRFAPDLIVSIRYGIILKAPVIDMPGLGILNLHSGLLPSYRGVLATFRALLHGDREIGCTLHRITDQAIDTGPVVATARVPVVPGRSLLWHILSLYPPGVALMTAALERLADGGELPVTPQASGGAYYSRPTAKEWTAFTAAGLRAVDARDLEAIVRLFTPGRAPASSRVDRGWSG